MDLAHVRIRITAPTPRWIASMPGTRTSTYSMNDGCETSRSSTIIYTYTLSTTTSHFVLNWRVPRPKKLLWGFTILTSRLELTRLIFQCEILNQCFTRCPIHSLILAALADLYSCWPAKVSQTSTLTFSCCADAILYSTCCCYLTYIYSQYCMLWQNVFANWTASTDYNLSRYFRCERPFLPFTTLFFLSTKTLENSSMSRAVFSSRIARLQSPHFYNINVTRRIAQHHPTSGLVDIISLQCINPNPIRFEKKVWMMRWYL
jgi:hypothetical protein